MAFTKDERTGGDMEGALQVAIDAGAFDVAMWIMIVGALHAVLIRLGNDGPGLLKALDRRAAVRHALRAREQIDRDHAYKVLETLINDNAPYAPTRRGDVRTPASTGLREAEPRP